MKNKYVIPPLLLNSQQNQFLNIEEDLTLRPSEIPQKNNLDNSEHDRNTDL